MRQNPEAAIQRALVQHLYSRGISGLLFWHTPNGGKRSIGEAANFKRLGVKAGVPDLLLYYNNQLFCLELKAPGGRATESQLAFLAHADAQGAYTATAEGLDRALATLEAWGLIA